MKGYLILTVMGLVALFLPWILVSCDRQTLSLGSDERREAPAVKMEVTDGLRTLERVLRRPGMTVTVVNGSDDSVYEAVFRVNGGPERTVRSIWNGVPKDLSGEFFSLSEYGPVSIEGYLYDTAVLTERIPLDTTLWMAYAPATRSAILIKSPGREEALRSGAVFTVAESGSLEIHYTPEDTFLNISLSVPEGSPLTLNGGSAVNRDGRFSVPFSVREAGETLITLTTKNGRDEEIHEYSVSCKEPVQNNNN